MNVQRMISAAALAAVAFCAQAPAAGASSTLLSGYGGPGQGNQAIIGSSLVGGGGANGGGGGSGSAGSSSSSSSSSSSIAVPQTQSVRPSTSASKPKPKPHAPTHVKGAGAAGSVTKAATPKVAVTALSADRGGGRTLGLSGADLAYIILAFGALALTALLTVLLTRRTGGAEGAQ